MVSIESVDLNLFAVLHAVSSEGSVAKAAGRLHVTPSAVSNALARLRGLLGDPLFVRDGRRLVATARAQALAPQVAAAMAALGGVLRGGEAFDPAASTRAFVLAATDQGAEARFGLIAAEFARRLPRARLDMVLVDAGRAAEGLRRGDYDVALGALDRLPPDALTDPVFIDDAVCVLGRTNSLRRLTLAAFLAAGHVRVAGAVRDEGDGVDAALARRGLTRRIALTVPHVAAAATCVVGTPYVATLPRRAAEALARVLPLRLVAPPTELPVVTAYQVWHPRTEADAGARCFREIIRTAAGRPPHRVPSGRGLR